MLRCVAINAESDTVVRVESEVRRFDPRPEVMSLELSTRATPPAPVVIASENLPTPRSCFRRMALGWLTP